MKAELCVEYRKTHTFAHNSNSWMSVGGINASDNKKNYSLNNSGQIVKIKWEVPVMVNFMWQRDWPWSTWDQMSRPLV